MEIKIFQAGPLSANNYLLTDNGESVLIDCSEFKPEILEGVNLKYIILTHAHFDHVLGVEQTKKTTNAITLMNQDDLPRLDENVVIMETFGANNTSVPKIDKYINENDIIKFGNSEIKVLHTPGHTQGSLSFLINDKLFSGDTLFKNYVGRCDLPSGSLDKLKESVKKLFLLPDDVTVYSGHGEITTIGYEKEYNEINNY